ncbi:hypothetical protein LOCC1_G008768 [Lachnellula occidentalis]|uniref:BTB domain-containing protein n=1 Tax=Lachnellula occidentalis TaxID=215460 RepID=A0A8H8RE27_9HELO|nr:hypothetical protein LOCC1_G008768 [Lachnellula occidentalis]
MASTFSAVQVTIIDPNGDLDLRLYTTKDATGHQFNSASNGRPIVGKIHGQFKVSRKVMVDSSSYFKAMLSSNWAESRQSVVDIECERPTSAELWYRVFHKSLVPDSLYDIPIDMIGNVIQYGGLVQEVKGSDADLEELREWFKKCLERLDLPKITTDELKMLLYPCYAFNHAQGFATVTKRLAYEMSGHVTEISTTEDRSIHLDGNVIGSVNGAKGSLRSRLIRGLFEPMDRFLDARCACKEKSLFAYCQGIRKTGIWPLQDLHKKSVQDILDSPGFVKFDIKIPDGACFTCISKLSLTTIAKVRADVSKDFDGLCLDCINMTKTGDVDNDYWAHDRMKHWGKSCRINHGQPSWYFSFVGRKTDMKNHQLKKKQARDLFRNQSWSDSD